MVNQIYIEIHNTYLLLVIIKNKKQEIIFDRKTTQIVPLNDLEFDDGVVNNPTTISRFIKNYVDSHNLKNPNGIVCLRNADKKEDFQKFITLQVSLLIAKAGINISKIVHGPLMPWSNASLAKGTIPEVELNNKHNLFSQFSPPKSTNPRGWVILSFVALACSSTMMSTLYINRLREATILEESHNTLSAQASKLSQKASKVNKLNAMVSKPKIKPDDQSDRLLEFFEVNIPEKSWLSALNKTPEGKFEIQGSTLDSSEIVTLIQSLDNSSIAKDISLGEIDTKNNIHKFTITGYLSV